MVSAGWKLTALVCGDIYNFKTYQEISSGKTSVFLGLAIFSRKGSLEFTCSIFSFWLFFFFLVLSWEVEPYAGWNVWKVIGYFLKTKFYLVQYQKAKSLFLYYFSFVYLIICSSNYFLLRKYSEVLSSLWTVVMVENDLTFKPLLFD